MTSIEAFAKFERKLRPLLTRLPRKQSVWLFTNGRKLFLNWLYEQKLTDIVIHSVEKRRKIWGIDFGCNLFNAAGMFKGGEGYNLVAAQGAGAYLAGTTTTSNRSGNKKDGILHPFAAYPRSGAASNWMGLPNQGHETVAKKLAGLEKQDYCPVGVSIASDPGQSGLEALNGLINGFQLYERAGVNFIELNESCPNVPHESSNNNNLLDPHLIERLEYINLHFLKKRNRNLPVIVKFSNDTDIQLLPDLLDVLTTLGFDGINLGNTSTEYSGNKKMIVPSEVKLFDYFINTFGGGVSGKPLKLKSLGLASFAANFIKNHPPQNEFHVIRTGGIETSDDLNQSNKAGISLNQWFTGYFEEFAKSGHNLYKNLVSE